LLSFAVQVARGLQFLTARLVSDHTRILSTLVMFRFILAIRFVS